MHIRILFFINAFLTGIIAGFSLTLTIIIILNKAKKLKPAIHFSYWLSIFVFLLFYYIEFIGIKNIQINVSEYILYFIPIFGLILVINLNHTGIKFTSFLFLLLPFAVFALKDRIPLFLLYYQIFAWLCVIAYAAVVYFINKKKKTMNRLFKFPLLWSITASMGFIPTAVINIIISISMGYPVIILVPLPSFILVSALVIYIYYYRIMIFQLNESAEKTGMLSKHSVKEKIAASLIHEIKNPIAAIQSLNQLLQMKFNELPGESVKNYLKIIADDLDRVKDLCESYLAAYKNDSQDDNIKDMDLYISIQSISDLLKFDLRKKEINLDLDKSVINKKISFNPNKFKQVFLNLFYNSIEANAKNIKIYSVSRKNSLELIFSDDGGGISPVDAGKIFEPFFSSKQDGTGIGLAICKNIMEESQGEIKLVSSKKGLTIFKLNFIKQKNGEDK